MHPTLSQVGLFFAKSKLYPVSPRPSGAIFASHPPPLCKIGTVSPARKGDWKMVWASSADFLACRYGINLCGSSRFISCDEREYT